MTLFNKKTLCAVAVSMPLFAQAQLVQFPMEVATDGTTYETMSHTASMVNGALSPVCVPGAKGKAWRLDGYSSYLEAAINPAAFQNKQQVTLSLWVAPESYPMMKIDENGEWFTTMVGNLKVDDNNTVATGDKGFAFQLGSRGSYRFICYVAGWQVNCESTEKLARYQWNHLVVTIDGTNRKVTMYCNNKQVATKNCTKGTFNPGNSTLYVGKSYINDKNDVFYLNTYNGLIDDFEIFDGIRTDILTEQPENAPQLTYTAERYASDLLRPAFHGMPTGGWTNETHGAVYYNGKYHLFFQKNPNGPYMARLNWGHLVSDNLYKWEEKPTAISPDEVYDLKGCWSGCVFTDEELTGGKPNIFYTGVDYGSAKISQAQPQDADLLSWNKSTNNPIINGRPAGLSEDFRDCYVFRNGDDLYMIVGCSKNGIGAATLHKYNKAAGTWSNDGKLFFSGTSASQDGTFWEMPNITQMGNKWLFTATPLGMGNGVRTIYWTGSINADGTFSPDSKTPKGLEMTGFSKEGYGLLSPTIFKKDDKTLLLGIVPDKLAASENYKMGYAHTYSLPREITLDSEGNLVQKPFDGLKAMRSDVHYTKSDFALSGTQDLSPVEGRCLELTGTFVVGNCDFGFTFLGDGNKDVKLTFSPANNLLVLDMSNINRINHDGVFNGQYVTTLPKSLKVGEEMKLTVYIDHSIIDIFVNDTYAASVRMFPRDADAIKTTVFCDGQVNVKQLEAYVLDVNKIATGIENVPQRNQADRVYGSKGTVNYNLTTENCTIMVFDVAGRCVKRLPSVSGMGSVPLQGHGVYLVKLFNQHGIVMGTYKVMA